MGSSDVDDPYSLSSAAVDHEHQRDGWTFYSYREPPSWECVLCCMGTRVGGTMVTPHIGVLLAGGDSMVSSLLMIRQERKCKTTTLPLSKITRDT